MSATPASLSGKSRLAAPLEHPGMIEDPRDERPLSHPLAEVLLLVVGGAIADLEDYDRIVAWGEAQLDFLRRHLPYENGVPGGRWLTLLMSCINPVLFAAAFTAWVRATWPDRPELRSTARPRAGATTVPRARRRSISSPPSPSTAGSPRPSAAATGIRRHRHGGRPPLRPEPRARRQGYRIHQAPPQIGRLDPGLPRPHPQHPRHANLDPRPCPKPLPAWNSIMPRAIRTTPAAVEGSPEPQHPRAARRKDRAIIAARRKKPDCRSCGGLSVARA
jgi:hypothetical protein